MTGYLKTLPVNQDDLWEDIADAREAVEKQVELFNTSRSHVCSMHVKYALDRTNCVMVCYTEPARKIFWIADIYKVE
jgi:hypothetical protein